MTYNFFAAEQDKIELLDFIFKETDLQIFDSYSSYGETICQYRSTREIAAKFDLHNGRDAAVIFQLWSPIFKAEPLFFKIDLDPRRCKGHTFRYSTNGWGLIRLYLGGVNNNILHKSHIGHFNQKGAMKWEGINKEKGAVDLWNWPEIEKTSRKLKYHIHNKMAVKKNGTYGILKGAEFLEQQGVAF